MTIRDRLQIIGQALTGSPKQEPIVDAVKTAKKKGLLLGTFLDLGKKGLSDEKSISSKLIEAFYEWVFINVTTLAEEVSKLEPELFKIVLKGGQYELQEIETHPVLDLLDRFNETTTQSDGFYLTDSHLSLTGDSFWYLEDGAGGKQPSNIYLLQPDKVTLTLGDVYSGASRLVSNYQYKTVIGDKEVSETYEPEEILHIKVPNPKNPYRGHSVVEGIATTLDIDSNTLQASKSFYENGMMAQFMLTSEKGFNQDQLKRLKAELVSAYSGAKNFFKIPIFFGGVKPETIQMSSKDAQMIDHQAWLRDKVMAAFKNTKASLGITEDVNRANAEASLRNWKQSTIKPRMCRIVDSLNEFLLPRYGDNLVLGFKNPVPEDQTEKITEATQLYGANIITLNEARDIVGYDNVNNGDEINQPTAPIPYTDQNLPKSLEGVNIKAVLRRSGLAQKKMDWQKAYEAAKPVAKQIRARKKEDTPISSISDKDKLDYQQKQIRLVDHAEEQIHNKLDQYFKGFIDRVANNVEQNLPSKKVKEEDLFNKSEEVSEIKEHLMPVFLSLANRSQSDAFGMIFEKAAVNPQYEFISDQVSKFADSLLETDRKRLVDIIAGGINDGKGAQAISRSIRSDMPDFTKNQANTIARTEALRTSNHSAIEAWKSSGVVAGKEWLCDSNPCPYCAPLNHKQISLEENYFNKGDVWFGAEKNAIKIDFADIEGGNLHPNCECTIVPLLNGEFMTGPGAEADHVNLVGKVWHAEGYDPGQPLLGNAFYVARNQADAANFGDQISSFNLELPESQILKIATQDQLVDIKKILIRKYGVDVNFDTAMPKYVLSKGLKAAEAEFDPLGGIAIYDKTLVPQELLKAVHIRQLEAQIDKRTKQFKDLKKANEDQASYIRGLEEILDIGDEHGHE